MLADKYFQFNLKHYALTWLFFLPMVEASRCYRGMLIFIGVLYALKRVLYGIIRHRLSFLLDRCAMSHLTTNTLKIKFLTPTLHEGGKILDQSLCSNFWAF